MSGSAGSGSMHMKTSGGGRRPAMRMGGIAPREGRPVMHMEPSDTGRRPAMRMGRIVRSAKPAR